MLLVLKDYAGGNGRSGQQFIVWELDYFAIAPKLGDLSSRLHSSGARGLRSSVGSALFPLREQGKHLVQGSAGF